MGEIDLRMAPCPKPFGRDAFFAHGHFGHPSAVADGCGTAARGGPGWEPDAKPVGDLGRKNMRKICKT